MRFNHLMRWACAAAAITLIAAPAANAITRYVDADAVGANTGLDWPDAYVELQSAMTAAVAGDEIWVAAGTYLPDFNGTTHNGNTAATFQLKSGVGVYGGFAGNGHPSGGETMRSQRNPGTNVTILSGEIGNTMILTDNSLHVVTGTGVDKTAVIDGFTITRGRATGANGGAGLDCLSSGSPTIIGCRFVDNVSAASGGAIRFQSGSTQPVVVNCTFRNNTSTSGRGGAIFCTSTNPTITNSTFYGNHAGQAGSGGGGLALVNASAFVNNSIFWGNTDAGASIQSAQILTLAGSVFVTYSIVQDTTPNDGTVIIGTGNKDLDPLFVDAAGGNITLMSTSPAIDAANNDADTDANAGGVQPLPMIDAAGNPRFVDVDSVVDTGAGTPPIVDMGAFEVPLPLLYVDSAATGSNNGTSWADAYTSLRVALAAAESSSAVTEIWVAKGTGPYTPDDPGGSRDSSFALRNGLALYGGFLGSQHPMGGETELGERDPVANRCVLTGDLNGDDTSPFQGIGDNVNHVVTAGSTTDATAVLDGFLVTGGNAGGTDPHNSGGGFFTEDGAPTVNNCLFVANRALNRGGGAYVDGSAATFNDCAFIGNIANVGAGFYTAFDPAPSLYCCYFAGNHSSGNGGAMFNNRSGPDVVNSLFVGNQSDLRGGAVFNNSTSSAAVDPMFTNCSFAHNKAGTTGGGFDGTSGPAVIINGILWGNSDAAGMVQSSQIGTSIQSVVTISYSIIQDLVGGGTLDSGANVNNFSSDPMFVGGPGSTWTDAATYNPVTGVTTFVKNAGGFTPGAFVDKFLNPDTTQSLRALIVGNTATEIMVVGEFASLGGNDIAYQITDYRLQDASPAVEAGDNMVVMDKNITMDCDGNDRIFNLNVDLGPFESQLCLTPGKATNPMPPNLITQVNPVSVNLSWDAAPGADSYNVYLGTPSPMNLHTAAHPSTSLNVGTLPNNSLILWRVDPVNECGETTGDLWRFNTGCAPLPGQAGSPMPTNGATNVPPSNVMVSWSAAANATSYDVYLSIPPAQPVLQGNTASLNFNLGNLSEFSQYLWRVDPRNACGATTGSNWSFTTGEAPPDCSGTVVGRHVFYDNSFYDTPSIGCNNVINGGNPCTDDTAIDTSKTAVLPGGPKTTYENYISYAKGINGIMIDIAGRTGVCGAITAADFMFMNTGRDGPGSVGIGPFADVPAMAPSSVTVRAGEGMGGSDRVVITWSNTDGATAGPGFPNDKNAWLQIDVMDTMNTGVDGGDRFWFGIAQGEGDIGNTADAFPVASGDQTATRECAFQGAGACGNQFTNPKPINEKYDYDKNGLISQAADYDVARNNPAVSSLTQSLRAFTPAP